MSYNYFINESFTVTQNANIYAEMPNVDYTVYDYIFNVNIGADGNALFATRDFVQGTANINEINENNVLINLSVNTSFIDSLLVDDKTTTINQASKNEYNSILTGQQKVGLRFLEVVALKVFGHARARAAISNDTEFYRDYSQTGSLIQQIADGMQNAINNKKASIFNQYVYHDLIDLNDNNDVDAPANFNFSSGMWEFPIYFQSSLVDVGGDANGMADVMNGPTNIGGALLVNGSMNVPILLRFSTTA